MMLPFVVALTFALLACFVGLRAASRRHVPRVSGVRRFAIERRRIAIVGLAACALVGQHAALSQTTRASVLMLLMRPRITAPIVADIPPDPPSGDGTAELPRASVMDPFKAWCGAATPSPSFFSAIVGAGRSVTVAASTESALQTALNTAAAMTGGDRLVILPHSFAARANINMPANADLTHDIYIVWAHMVDGTYTIARGTRMPRTKPAGIPRIETTPAGSEEQPVLQWSQSAAKSRYKFYGVDIRIAAAAAGNRACGCLVDIAELGSSTAGDPTDTPYYILFSHMYIGGTKFGPDGNWRTGGVGRAFYDGSRGFACLDSVNDEHGGGTTGDSRFPDRGFYTAITGQGPTWLDNIYSDFGGGIVTLWGGGGTPEAWPIHCDVEVAHCVWSRSNIYNKWHADAELDGIGGKCDWGTKNMGEIKTARYVWWHHNVYSGQRIGVSGQYAAVVFKSNVQEAAARQGKTADVTFEDNVVLSGVNGIHVSPAEHLGTAPGGVYGLRGMTIRRNLIVYGMFNDFPDNSIIGNDAITVGFHAVSERPPSILLQPTRDWLIDQNWFECAPEGNPRYNLLFDCSTGERGAGGVFSWTRNAWARYGTFTVTNPDDYGLNAMLDASRYESSVAITFADNVLPAGDPGSHFSSWPQIYTWTDKAAMGISNGSGVGRRVQASDSPLRTGAHDGSRIGPNFAYLDAMRTMVESGVIT